MVKVLNCSFYHMPQWFDYPSFDGVTLRKCLKKFREINWGDLGEATANLSDGSVLHVELEPASDSGYLMDCQRARRESPSGRTIRYYILN